MLIIIWTNSVVIHGNPTVLWTKQIVLRTNFILNGKNAVVFRTNSIVHRRIPLYSSFIYYSYIYILKMYVALLNQHLLPIFWILILKIYNRNQKYFQIFSNKINLNFINFNLKYYIQNELFKTNIFKNWHHDFTWIILNHKHFSSSDIFDVYNNFDKRPKKFDQVIIHYNFELFHLISKYFQI